jgi:hypothetical protein
MFGFKLWIWVYNFIEFIQFPMNFGRFGSIWIIHIKSKVKLKKLLCTWAETDWPNSSWWPISKAGDGESMAAGRRRRSIPGGLPVKRVRGGAIERCFAVGNPIWGGNRMEAHQTGSFHGGVVRPKADDGARPDERSGKPPKWSTKYLAMRGSSGRWQRTSSGSKAVGQCRGGLAAKERMAPGSTRGFLTVDGSAHGRFQLDGDAAVHEAVTEASGGVLIGARRLEQRCEQRLAWSGKWRKQPLLLDEGLQRIRAGGNRRTWGDKCTWGRRLPMAYSHHPRCYVHAASDWCGRLGGVCDWQAGASFNSNFQWFSLTWILKFETATFSIFKILQILQRNSLKHKEQLSFFDAT